MSTSASSQPVQLQVTSTDPLHVIWRKEIFSPFPRKHSSNSMPLGGYGACMSAYPGLGLCSQAYPPKLDELKHKYNLQSGIQEKCSFWPRFTLSEWFEKGRQKLTHGCENLSSQNYMLIFAFFSRIIHQIYELVIRTNFQRSTLK